MGDKIHPLTKVFICRAWGSVEFVVRSTGSCPAEDFWNEIEEVREGKRDDEGGNAKAKFTDLFRQLATDGTLPAKRLVSEDGFSAVKLKVANVQIRFPCFVEHKKWIVTHGFKKPGGKKGRGPWPQREIEKTQQIRGEYFLRKKELASK